MRNANEADDEMIRVAMRAAGRPEVTKVIGLPLPRRRPEHGKRPEHSAA